MKIIYYIWSFFKPVIKPNNEQILVMIRGISFLGRTREDIFRQMESYIKYLRGSLQNDFYNAAFMQGSGNIHGKWNAGIITMNNTRKTLEALEVFYQNNNF